MLILAATPIGNLGDIPPRLTEAFKAADSIFAEDTRHTRKLLSHLGIEKKLDSYHAFSGEPKRQHIGKQLSAGRAVVYVSDAGMPGISDPGYDLVRLAMDLEVEVDVIPGPCAVINALVLSGLPTDTFCFLGFFPHKNAQREMMVQRLGSLEMTAVFFEAPTRIAGTLNFLAQRLPEQALALCREMTKRHQQVLRGTATQISEALVQHKGEMVLVIAPLKTIPNPPSLSTRFKKLQEEGHSEAATIRMLAQEMRLSKREIKRMLQQPESL